MRQRLEALWDARAYDHAGMTEVGAYGFECTAQAGLHVNELEFIAEVLEPESGRPVAPGEVGELTLTNLGRWGAPVLRYRSGDRVRLDATAPARAAARSRASREASSAGSTTCWSCAASTCSRRRSRGSCAASPSWTSSRSRCFAAGVLDEVRLLLEIDGSARPPGTVRATVDGIAEAVRRDLGIRVEVTAVPARTLPRYELKARRVVRRVEPGA